MLPGVPREVARGRLEFLDFARAVAALSVVLMHVFSEWSPGFRRWTLEVFNPGVFGVITFFLVSGFVIPFSLERLDSAPRFWLNRVFRLFPLYWFSLASVVVLHACRLGAPPPDFVAALPGAAWWNVVMVQFLFDVPSAIGLYWTLSYEMIFYAGMSVLFLVGWHKKAHWLLLGGALFFLHFYVIDPLSTGQVRLHIPYFWVLTFWVGTAAYRVWSDDSSARPSRWAIAAFVVAVVLAALVNYAVVGMPSSANDIHPRAFVSAWAGAYAFFGALLWFRRATFPRAALWLGRISYSIYIVHGLILQIEIPVAPLVLVGIRLAAAVGVSSLTYRFVEEPFLRWGKTLSAARPRGAPAP